MCGIYGLDTSATPLYSAASVEVVKVELLTELSSKVDFIMHQQRILIKLYPEEATFKKPKNFPSLPLQSENEFKNFETFLATETNFTSTVR